jgi:hypothetical protein
MQKARRNWTKIPEQRTPRFYEISAFDVPHRGFPGRKKEKRKKKKNLACSIAARKHVFFCPID